MAKGLVMVTTHTSIRSHLGDFEYVIDVGSKLGNKQIDFFIFEKSKNFLSMINEHL